MYAATVPTATTQPPTQSGTYVNDPYSFKHCKVYLNGAKHARSAKATQVVYAVPAATDSPRSCHSHDQEPLFERYIAAAAVPPPFVTRSDDDARNDNVDDGRRAFDAIAVAATTATTTIAAAVTSFRDQCYAISMHPLLMELGLVFTPFPSMDVYYRSLSRAPRTGAATRKLFFGMLPSVMSAEQLEATIIILANVTPRDVRFHLGRGHIAGCAMVEVDAADAHKVIASLHKRVLIDEKGWHVAVSEAQIAHLHAYCEMVLSKSEARYQNRSYLPITVAFAAPAGGGAAAHQRGGPRSADGRALDTYHPACRCCAQYRLEHTDFSFLFGTYLPHLAPTITLENMMPVHSTPPPLHMPEQFQTAFHRVSQRFRERSIAFGRQFWAAASDARAPCGNHYYAKVCSGGYVCVNHATM